MDYIHRKITEFFNTLNWNDLPGHVRHEERRAVMDALGCLLAGLRTSLGESLCQMAPLNKVNEGAVMIGGAENLNP
ncbi:MmgE/PrpD family protein [Desulfococcaceae bacterium HSG9]|nr:MmgE/PrpD family protein [Desulfococcaceae bacterium HSG9]